MKKGISSPEELSQKLFPFHDAKFTCESTALANNQLIIFCYMNSALQRYKADLAEGFSIRAEPDTIFHGKPLELLQFFRRP